MKYIAAFDLGTGGLKASLYDAQGKAIASEFRPYPTNYISEIMHEQAPQDWWDAFCSASKCLIEKADPADIACICVSGHSLVCIPCNRKGEILLSSVPIWSDTRASAEAEDFFRCIPYEDWYCETGNGDSPGGYSVFKLMWMKKHQSDIWAETEYALGSKDYVNLMLTGKAATDHSYASGSGVYSLRKREYSQSFLSASGLEKNVFLPPLESHDTVGYVNEWAAGESGFAVGTRVAAGGVDNALMALGTLGNSDGKAYISLGSCAWISLTSRQPVTDLKSRPYIFAFTEKDYFVSGVSIFAGGSSHRWAADKLFADINGPDKFDVLNSMAAKSPAGANGLIFNPTLSGASPQEPGENLKGCLYGLSLANDRNDIIRAVLEGIALSLKANCYDVIKKYIDGSEGLLITGGGTKSPVWMQIFADVFNTRILQSSEGQDATSKGAACVGAKAAGLIRDCSEWSAAESCAEFWPTKSLRSIYDEKAEKFKKLIESLISI